MLLPCPSPVNTDLPFADPGTFHVSIGLLIGRFCSELKTSITMPRSLSIAGSAVVVLLLAMSIASSALPYGYFSGMQEWMKRSNGGSILATESDRELLSSILRELKDSKSSDLSFAGGKAALLPFDFGIGHRGHSGAQLANYFDAVAASQSALGPGRK
ncbi:hypothetical protein RvY_09210 [Ramazzottius varieornatus]|uniref:Uncharacterized protein n=1 Tax=Ramazzottius varieornatus TaxID=947166 RepID=A0A1D1V8L0_RAMVA|nr:hypothetical protein RvY_09210 [Ramazzottius varieornatus]